ncbi:MAG: protein kinase [Myxococcales bacterium]|nr:protein kinase [Myxococcales bacterium]
MVADHGAAGAGPCPDTEALCGMVEGRLDGADRGALERHLEGCSLCRRALIEVGHALAPSAADAKPADAARSTHTPSLEPGPAKKLGRYEIRREVGLGGMGVVYEGWDPALGRRIALKLMRPDRVGAGNGTAELAAEARALATILHPNVLTVFDVGVEGDAVFIAAEYVEGVTMDKGWPHKARAWRDRLDAYLEVARGLAAIHAAGITHRDIKPSNILLSHDGRVKIADFGLAVRRGQDAAAGGTPAYMAPEQARGEITPAADQYALAVCIVEALLGVRLGADTTADDLAGKAQAQWGKSGPPRALWQSLARSLADKPGDRFPNVDALVAALERAASDDPASRSRRPVWQWAVGAGLAAAAMAAAFAYGVRQSSETAAAPSEPSPAAVPSVGSDGTAVVSGAATTSEQSVGAPSSSPSVALPQPKNLDEKAGVPRASEGNGLPPVVAPPGATGTAPPENPVLAAIEQQNEANKLLAQIPDAIKNKDGKKCMALIDQAKKLAPQVVSGMSTTIATCEMMSGKCDQGASRIETDKNLGAASKGVADNLRAMYCPASSSQSTAQERLKAVMFQAAAGPYTAARCEQFVAQTEKAIKDHGSDKPDGSTMAGAWSNTAMCFAWVGNCARAKQIVRKLVSGPDAEEKLTKWVRQSHPNCKDAE